MLDEHLFRHEYGRLVAMLCRRLGVVHLASIEDAVQSAMLNAVRDWPIHGLPASPSAWLYRVSYNAILGELRRESDHHRILERFASDLTETYEGEGVGVPHRDSEDDLLRLLFVCCQESIPVESQLVFALKTLCGFGIGEIAIRLFTSEANVYKRFGRARDLLRELSPDLDLITEHEFQARLPAVQKVLYLLFTEGYLSSHAETAVRRELCDEAIRLTLLLANQRIGCTPETCALLALMFLQTARLSARQDEAGGLLLLEEQDRALWDQELIRTGLCWLEKSAAGDNFSRFHAEAGIIAEHCLARSHQETRWDRIAKCYLLLEQIAQSPLHTLNRSIAVAEGEGPEAGLSVLREMEPPIWLTESYLWSATWADLYRRTGDTDNCTRYRDQALANAPNSAIRDLLRRRLCCDPVRS
jgi:RNA polymerase sigma factor (sigma-70 family)